MGERDSTRRGFVRRSLAAAGPAVVAANTLPFLSAPAEAGAARATLVSAGGRRADPHRARAWMEGGLRASRLYFFEVNSGSQTEGFLPNTYVDISSVVEQKKAALFAHVSQDGQGIWREHHEIMAQWRGREAGVPAAEAFVHLNRDDHTHHLPGL